MAEMLTTIEGTLIGYRERNYDSFTDGNDRVVPGGVTRRIWLAGAYDSPPAEVKVSDPDLFTKIKGAGQWAVVRMTCKATARRNSIELTALDVVAAESAGK